MHRVAQAAAVAVVIALLGVLVWKVVNGNGGKIAHQVDNGQIVIAPPFVRSRLDTTGRLGLASLRGKVVVLNFWATWCIPCKQEARTLEAVANEWKSKGVVFVGINEESLTGDAKAFLAKYGVTYPQVKDDGSLEGHYGVIGYPETFFVNRKGMVVPPHIAAPATRQQLDAGIRGAIAS